MKAVFAPVGAIIPGSGEVLKRATIRGIESNGMLCSARELLLGEDHEGIIELAADAPVGRPASEAIAVEGPVIDVALTPNRSDCFGVLGIARELAAAGLGELKSRTSRPVPGSFQPPLRITLDFPDGRRGGMPAVRRPRVPGRCATGRARAGCRSAWRRSACARSRRWSTSPTWSRWTSGGRCTCSMPTSCAATSCCALPRPGERLAALDGRTYELDPEVTVIADELGRDQPRRHHGRREHRLHRGDHRGGAGDRPVRSQAHRDQRPPARASRAMRAPASSAASTRRWCCRAWSTRPG